MSIRPFIISIIASALTAGTVMAADELVIRTDRPGAEVQPTMYGLFFEDINYAADGGLYAEKVKNRSFEFPNPLMGWESFGNVSVKTGGPFERNPHYVTLMPVGHRDKASGLTNEGYFGVSFSKGEGYRFSLWARPADGGKDSKIIVELIDPASEGETQVMARATVEIDNRNGRTARQDASGSVYAITCDGEDIPPYVNFDYEYFPTGRSEDPIRSDVATLYFNAGRREKISRGDIAGYLIKTGGLEPGEVGRISVADHYAIAAVPRGKVSEVVRTLAGTKLKGTRVKVTPLKP